METKNVFEETIEILIEDAKKLQAKFSKCQESNNFTGALSYMRLLKDTLSLIKEYDWELKYSEYETDGHKEVSIWKQNHCGEIKDVKRYRITEQELKKNVWIEKFESCINERRSYICTYGDECRNTGKSYALAKLCNKYKGIVVYKNRGGILGIENADDKLSIVNTFIPYDRGINLKQFENKIVFIDEGSGLTNGDIDVIKRKHIVVGFI